jgi:competence protein ComEA
VAGRAGDKRTLVLFLFGTLALAAEMGIFPGAKALPPIQYGVQLVPLAPGGYRVVCHPVDTGRGDSETVLLDPMQPIPAEVPARFALYLHQPLPINRADRDSLEMLPGIGPRLAQAIVNSIERDGPVADPVALQRINGIGPKMADRLAPMIRFH